MPSTSFTSSTLRWHSYWSQVWKDGGGECHPRSVIRTRWSMALAIHDIHGERQAKKTNNMRSLWKGPFLDRKLLKLAQKIDSYENTPASYEVIDGVSHPRGVAKTGVPSTKPKGTKTWSRRSIILPQFVGLTFQVHNGNRFIPVRVTEEMIGHRFGEFSPTRKPTIHKEAKKKK